MTKGRFLAVAVILATVWFFASTTNAVDKTGSVSLAIVRAEDGTPVENGKAALTLSLTRGDRDRLVDAQLHGARYVGQGVYLVDSVPVGEYLALARAPGRAIGLTRVEVKERATARSLIKLPASGLVDGRVEDVQGRPRPGVRVRVAYTEPSLLELAADMVNFPGWLSPSGLTDEEGGFAIHDGVVPGAAFVVEADDASFLPVYSEQLQVNDERASVYLVVGEEGANLRGTVLDAANQAVRQARIGARVIESSHGRRAVSGFLFHPLEGPDLLGTSRRRGAELFADGLAATRSKSVLSRQDGTFSIAGLPEGTVQLTVTAPGYRPWEATLPLGSGEAFVNVILEPTGPR